MNQDGDEIFWSNNNSSLNSKIGNDANRKDCSRFPKLEEDGSSLSDVLEGWRFPELSEVIHDLRSSDDEVKLNAAAYLQHLAYKNDSVKSSARELNAFEPLIEMLHHSNYEVVRSALGALRNLSCGKANDLNKVEITANCGVQILIEIIRTSKNQTVVEMASGLLWNLSSCPILKDEILQKSLDVIFNYIIMPLLCCISADIFQPPHKLIFSNFRHATGVLRNVSSGSKETRDRLNMHGGLINSLMSFLSWSSKHRDVDEKSIENCLCTMRNLTLNPEELNRPSRSRSMGRRTDTKRFILDSSSSSCFSIRKSSKNQKESIKFSLTDESLTTDNTPNTFKLLIRPESISIFIHLLKIHCNKVDICEATLGIIQNLCLSNFQPSWNVLESVRKFHGLPVIATNLTSVTDKLVLAACEALKQLTTDHINQDIIGRIIVDQLLNESSSSKCESPYPQETHNFLSAAIFECIGPNAEFARYMLVTGGIKQLKNVVLSPASFGIRTSELAAIVSWTENSSKSLVTDAWRSCQMLRKMWSFHELHEEMRVLGLRKADFMIEPPKKGSVEDLISDMDGKWKKVRFGETPSVEGFRKSLPNVLPPTSKSIQTHPFSSSQAHNCKGVPPISEMFVSNTLPKLSISSKPIAVSTFASPPRHSMASTLPMPLSETTDTQLVTRPNDIFVPANSWV